jgi:hypothetical protein
VLLGILVHKVSGMFYGDFLAERVFAPLGMGSTRVISESDIVKNRAAGYTIEKGKLQNQEWVSPSLNPTADGSLYTTTLDLAKWDAALWSKRFLKPESYEAMWSPVRLHDGTTYPYGFAWFLDVQRHEPAIQHSGSWQGFKTAIVRYPGRKLTVIVLANLAEAEPMRLATTVAGLVESELAWPPMQAAVVDPDQVRTARLREVLQSWAKGEPSPGGVGAPGHERGHCPRAGGSRGLAAATRDGEGIHFPCRGRRNRPWHRAPRREDQSCGLLLHARRA